MANYDEAVVRKRLNAERERLERDIYDLTQGDDSATTVDPLLDADGAAGDQADNADALSDYDRNQAMVRNSRALLQQVNDALERLDNGQYGLCEVCGKPIDPRRLEAIPWATRDVEHQEIADRTQP